MGDKNEVGGGWRRHSMSSFYYFVVFFKELRQGFFIVRVNTTAIRPKMLARQDRRQLHGNMFFDLAACTWKNCFPNPSFGSMH